MNRRGKKWVKKKGVKVEEAEARAFDRAYAKLHEDFNNFLFNNGRGSFLEFEVRYRTIATQPWRFIKPDPDDFFNFAILR